MGPGQDEELYSPSKETGNYSLSEIKEADFVANISSKVNLFMGFLLIMLLIVVYFILFYFLSLFIYG